MTKYKDHCPSNEKHGLYAGVAGPDAFKGGIPPQEGSAIYMNVESNLEHYVDPLYRTLLSPLTYCSCALMHSH